jgi:hypothetical protein
MVIKGKQRTKVSALTVIHCVFHSASLNSSLIQFSGILLFQVLPPAREECNSNFFRTD